jgi:hypothetical protein
LRTVLVVEENDGHEVEEGLKILEIAKKLNLIVSRKSNLDVDDWTRLNESTRTNFYHKANAQVWEAKGHSLDIEDINRAVAEVGLPLNSKVIKVFYAFKTAFD